MLDTTLERRGLREVFGGEVGGTYCLKSLRIKMRTRSAWMEVKMKGKKKHYYLVSLAASRVSVAGNTIDDKRK